MALRIRVPGLVDVVLCRDPASVRALADDPRVDRRFVARGPLINRLITGRIRKWFQIDGQPLPSLAPRDDNVRAERQRDLAAALDAAAGANGWTTEELAALADYVRGAGARDDVGRVTQEIIGRRFDPHFQADAASWEAAKLIDRFRNGFSLEQLLWIASGRLANARALLAQRASNDRWAFHGIAIGVHGIVDALVRMRELRAGSEWNRLPEEAVLWRTLQPPRQVPRVVEETISTPLAASPLRAGTFVMFMLSTAWPKAPGPELVFMPQHWSACPAAVFVQTLLSQVYRAVQGERAG
jgi:hypothetical protein